MFQSMSALLGAVSSGAGEAMPDPPMGVVPVLIGPFQALLTLLPAILMALGGLIVAMFRWSTVKKVGLLLWKKKIGTLITVGAIVGAVYGLKAIWPDTREEARQAEAVVVPWTMFRGGPERRGWVPGGEDPVEGEVNWAHTEDCKTYWSSPCVVGNRVYASSANKGAMKIDIGRIYCLDADNGAIVWKNRPRKYLATFSSPSVAGKYLVCGEGLHFTKNARVVCMDIEHDGRILWTYETKSHVESSPCIDLERGRVYIGAGDDGYYCFALDPKGGKADVLWHLEGDKYPDSETSPAAADGKVYAGLGIKGNAICCIDGKSGNEDWRIETPYPVFGPPTISGGRLYVAMGNGNFVETAEQVWAKEFQKLRSAGASAEKIAAEKERMKAVGEVWCVDLKTHDVLWKYEADRVVLGAVAVKGERLYFGSRDGNLYCVSTDGELITKWNSRAPILTSPAVAEEHVYVVNQSGVLFALDAETLEPTGWERQLGLSGMFLSSPCVARGHVYVGTDTEGLLCVGEPPAEGKIPVNAGRLGGPGRSGWDRTPLPVTASYAWRYPESGIKADQAPITAPAMVFEGALYVGLQTEDRTGLARLDLVEEEGKTVPMRRDSWFFGTSLPVGDTAASGGTVFAVTGAPGGTGRLLHALAADGLWKGSQADLEMLLTPLASENDKQDTAGLVKALAASGALRRDGETISLDVGRGKAALVEAVESHKLVRDLLPVFPIEPDGAVEYWKRPIADDASGRLLATEDTLYIFDRPDGLSAVHVRGDEAGRDRWTATLGRCMGSPVLTSDLLVVTTLDDGGALVALNPLTGAEVWRQPLPAEPTTGPVVQEDVLCVGSTVGVSAHSVLGGVALWHAPVGSVAGDLVCDRSRVACLTADGGLVLLDWVDGRELKRFSDVVPGVPPLMTRDAVLFCQAQSIQRFDFTRAADAKPRRWMLTSWMGRVTAPLVMFKSHVFVPTAKRGLVCARPKKG